MAVRQHFLGWDRPVLHAAVLWMRQQAALRQHHDTDLLDLADWLVVVPGRQARRRLSELLAGGLPGEKASQRPAVISPPDSLTLGQLPDALYDGNLLAPDMAVADDFTRIAAWRETLQNADPALRSALLPHWRDAAPFAHQWALARTIATTQAQLGNARMDYAALAASDLGHESDRERWQVLATLEAAYTRVLHDQGLIDPAHLRRMAIERQACRLQPHSRLVLLATPQLPPMAMAMIQALEQAEVDVLIAAPQAHAPGFDQLGLLHNGYWAQQQVAIDDAALMYVDHEAQLPEAVLHEQGLRAERDTANFRLDHLTIGVTDTALVQPLVREMRQAGLPVRYAGGRSAMRTQPVAVLGAMRDLSVDGTFARLADLLRLADMQDALNDHLQSCPDMPTGADEDWATFLDGYISEHIPAGLDQPPLGSEQQQQRLTMVTHWLDELWRVTGAAGPSATQTLARWAGGLRALLARLYTRQATDSATQACDETLESLALLTGVLDRLERLMAADAWMDALTFPEAVGLVLEALEGASLPQPADPTAAEVTGFLELVLDDAPHLLLLGVNEGRLPAASRPDPLLPDAVRGRLGLEHDQSRFARDCFYLNIILATRGDSALFTARHNAEGDPLHISRLLLACAHDTQLERLDRFYGEDRRASALLPTLDAGHHGDVDDFRIPRPRVWKPFRASLSITALRDYIGCPYSFYLRHIEKLRPLRDNASELDPAHFGSLAHDVLEAFSRDPQAACEREKTTLALMHHHLDRQVAIALGPRPPISVRLQIEQMRPRLDQFARWHARTRHEGWQTVEVESQLQASWDVDGRPIELRGRIDRIDIHREHGWRIIDYKTSDQPRDPMKTHYSSSRGWIDFQLPLYLVLVGQKVDPQRTQLGYYCLPREIEKCAWVPATWDAMDIEQAWQAARDVVRNIRQQIFWPPQGKWTPGDLVELCGVEAFNFASLSAPQPPRRGAK